MNNEMHALFGVGQIGPTLAAQDIQPNGLAFTHHRRMIPERFDFEVGFLIGTPVKAAGRVKPGTLPAATVARTVSTAPLRRPARCPERAHAMDRGQRPHPADEPVGVVCRWAAPQPRPGGLAHRIEPACR